jgi:hypothetical protein
MVRLDKSGGKNKEVNRCYCRPYPGIETNQDF